MKRKTLSLVADFGLIAHSFASFNSSITNNSTNSSDTFGNYSHDNLSINEKLGFSVALGVAGIVALGAALTQISKNFNKYNLIGMVRKNGLPTLFTGL